MKIADFGLAKYECLLTNTFVGTPLYMAPEIGRECTWQSDIWSLGVLVYELFFNKVPFPGSDIVEIVKNIISTKLKFPPDANIDIMRLTSCMLKMDPK